MANVVVMANPIHELAAAISEMPAPVPMMAGGHVGKHRRGAGPLLEVRALGIIVRGGVAVVLVVSARQADRHRFHLADNAVEHQLHCVAKAPVRTLLRAGLKNRFLLRRFFVDRHAFGEQMRDGFFAVNILAIAQRLERLQRVPMVGRADDDHIQILARAQLAKIRVRVARLAAVFFADRLRSRLAAELAVATAAIVCFVRVARGNHLNIRLTQERTHHARPATTRAGEGHSDAVARRHLCAPQHGTGNNSGSNHCC